MPVTTARTGGTHADATDERAAYLDYLKMCMRQQREPAPEVVEMGRIKAGNNDASLLSLQIRTAEEQLGILRAPYAVFPVAPSNENRPWAPAPHPPSHTVIQTSAPLIAVGSDAGSADDRLEIRC
jgi:hypothetical protein